MKGKSKFNFFEIFETIRRSDGIKIYTLAKDLGIRYGSMESLLSNMEQSGFLISEDKAKLFVFED